LTQKLAKKIVFVQTLFYVSGLNLNPQDITNALRPLCKISSQFWYQAQILNYRVHWKIRIFVWGQGARKSKSAAYI